MKICELRIQNKASVFKKTYTRAEKLAFKNTEYA